MTRFTTALRALLVVTAGASLAACDLEGLGDGNGLKSLSIVRSTSLLDATKKFSYQCFPDRLQLQGTFDSGGIGDYTERAVWSSSAPDIVAVSNEDIAVDDPDVPPELDDLVYPFGTILPKKVGVATITANFVGLSASYEVEVVATDLSKLQISDTSITLAPETARALSITTEIDGYKLNLASLNRTSWSFETPPEDDEDTEPYATIGASNGAITAIALGAPLVAQAVFPLCKNADGTQLRRTAQVNILAPSSVALAREFPGEELIVGNTEQYKVTASFANGQTQDISSFVTLTSSDTTVLKVASPLIPNQFTALKAGAVTLSARYGGDDDNDDEDDTDPDPVSGDPIPVSTVAGELKSFDIEASDKNVNVTALQTHQFDAVGTYLVNGANRTQRITRGVAWQSTQPAPEPEEGEEPDPDAPTEVSAALVFPISNLAVTAGLATSALITAATYKVKATTKIDDGIPNDQDDSDDDLVTVETQACVVVPGDEGAACPPPDDGEEEGR